MNLLSALNLLWLIPLCGGIIALWMLRLKRQDVTVSSLYLWRDVLAPTQSNAPLQKLRRHLLLFLQLLAAFLLIFALARPFVYGQAGAGGAIVVIVDSSASMNATDVQPSRLAAAKEAAKNYLDREMRLGDVATVIAATAKPSTSLSFTTDRGRVKQAIDDIAPTDTIADMPGALALAQSLIGNGNGARVKIFSDGAFGPDAQQRLSAITLGGADVSMQTIGAKSADNVAITAMDGRRDPVSGEYEVFVNVENLGGRPHEGTTLTLLRDGRVIDSRSLTFAGGSQSETFTGPDLTQGGLITARLDGLKDDLDRDDTASLALATPRKRRVLLVSSGNLFLERGLNIDPDVVLEEVAPSEFTASGKGGAGYDLVVFDAFLPKGALKPGNYLLFNALGPQSTFTSAGAPSEEATQIIDQDRTHPLMRYVDLSGLALAKSPTLQLALWAESLAETQAGPLVAAGEHDGARVVGVGFDLGDSDWPLRVSFPIFLTNCVNWLTSTGGLGPASPDSIAGTVVSLTTPPGLSSVKITRPDGKSDWVSAPPDGGVALFDQADEVGVYQADAGASYHHPFAVNLLNKYVSTLTPESHPELTRAPSGAPVKPLHLQPVRSEYWTAIAAAALVFLLLEWLVFHRRV
ncbi:hypothetical protein CCAX7_38980 [Capsulimonas corticalis]|uniref:Uncharacterized protein n=1 Tax=Capsulimonas corticalis TaxID=2219043 RepID=A0A402D3L9_9BACT|nr:VWA domain-containing protein [Capsulimonas corticalis]BDI31847.1 hypothetical protein CCAX7_38980 [Capsulimonas corticalis]